MVTQIVEDQPIPILVLGTVAYLMFADLIRDWFDTFMFETQLLIFGLIAFVVILAVYSGDRT